MQINFIYVNIATSTNLSHALASLFENSEQQFN